MIPPPKITPSEFYKAFSSTIFGSTCRTSAPFFRIGIAVSGGVDSMALARLCMSIKVAPTLHPHQFEFNAFIVDHMARPSSTVEALLVKKKLQSWGLPARVLQLQWPAGVESAQLPNFETQARRLRYQALGTACRDRHISCLLTAHHEDDQAECVLLRLAQGHRCMGLRGMGPVKRIPECWGIHGVHESGLKEEIEGMTASKKFDLRQERPSASVPFEATIPLEDGGITIHRPLLGFSKDRLRATCEASGVKWVEDETNRDLTRTARNAIRHLLREGSLPRSLQKPSLLALKGRMGAKANGRTARANAAFEVCDVSMLDTRVGTMAVRLPSRVTNTKFVPPAHRQEIMIARKYKAALLLRQLLEIVSPRQDTIVLPKLDFAIDAIFPDIINPAATDLDKILLPGHFTTNGVSLQRVRSPWQEPEDRNATKLQFPLDKEFIWVLTRQPFFRSENPTIEINPSQKYPDTESQPSSPLTRAAFQLWDSRYWIRVYNPTSSILRIQPLRDIHLSQLRSSYNGNGKKKLNDILHVAAPGKVRYTLPVLLQEKNGVEQVVALPTLGVANPKREIGVKWEVRYKKVTLPRKTDIPRVVI